MICDVKVKFLSCAADNYKCSVFVSLYLCIACYFGMPLDVDSIEIAVGKMQSPQVVSMKENMKQSAHRQCPNGARSEHGVTFIE